VGRELKRPQSSSWRARHESARCDSKGWWERERGEDVAFLSRFLTTHCFAMFTQFSRASYRTCNCKKPRILVWWMNRVSKGPCTALKNVRFLMLCFCSVFLGNRLREQQRAFVRWREVLDARRWGCRMVSRKISSKWEDEEQVRSLKDTDCNGKAVNW